MANSQLCVPVIDNDSPPERRDTQGRRHYGNLSNKLKPLVRAAISISGRKELITDRCFYQGKFHNESSFGLYSVDDLDLSDFWQVYRKLENMGELSFGVLE
jgi:hypothetical protein